MKTKDFALQVKAVEEDGTFEGYASTFGGPPDAYGEVVEAGAFSASLAEHHRSGTMPLLLWQHNSSEPIGRWMELAEDGKGLWGKGVIEVEAGPLEKRIHTHLKQKNIRGVSIGYREKQVEEPKGGKPRRLLEVDLIEASIVSFPANRRARVESVKSERMEEFARRLRDGEPMPTKEFEDILRDVGVPKALATQIASVGYAKAIRSESEGSKAIRAALAALKS